VPDPSVQPPEGLRKILIEKFIARGDYRTEKDTPDCPNCGEGCAGHEEETYHYTCGEVVPCSCATDAVDAVLAALFDACEVRERWGTRWTNSAGDECTAWWTSRAEAQLDWPVPIVLLRRCVLSTPPEPEINT
jgi:hypothetical protein